MRKKSIQQRSAQDIQDRIFRKMSAEKSIRLASNFFHFAQVLHRLGNHYDGTRGVVKKNRQDS